MNKLRTLCRLDDLSTDKVNFVVQFSDELSKHELSTLGYDSRQKLKGFATCNVNIKVNKFSLVLILDLIALKGHILAESTSKKSLKKQMTIEFHSLDFLSCLS